MKQLLFNFLCCLVVVFVTGCGNTEGPSVKIPPKQHEAIATPYTLRLPGSSPEEIALMLAQTVYPATREDNAVGAIILVPQDEKMAFLAMQRITHMPVNAPLLYLTLDKKISKATFKEMKRLRPDGVIQDGRTQVYAINVPASEIERIEKKLKYKVRAFKEPDPIKLSELLDRWQAGMKADFPDEVVISAIDHPEGMKYGIGEMGWNAHMGKGFAWVYKDSIPEATKEILKRRPGAHACYIYLTGGPDVISDKVAIELSQYGAVRRIYGENIYASSFVNAGYKDYGRNFGWGWNWKPRAFGWGIAQAGHNFIFCNPDNLLMAISASVLGHMGKHGPILLVKKNEVTKSVRNYLEMVKPFPTGPQETILNFGWIIGNEKIISKELQKELDQLLSPFTIKKKQLSSDTTLSDTLQILSYGK